MQHIVIARSNVQTVVRGGKSKAGYVVSAGLTLSGPRQKPESVLSPCASTRKMLGSTRRTTNGRPAKAFGVAKLINCYDRKCAGKIKFKKPSTKGEKPRGECTICGQKYIAAYNCNGKMRVIRI